MYISFSVADLFSCGHFGSNPLAQVNATLLLLKHMGKHRSRTTRGKHSHRYTIFNEVDRDVARKQVQESARARAKQELDRIEKEAQLNNKSEQQLGEAGSSASSAQSTVQFQ